MHQIHFICGPTDGLTERERGGTGHLASAWEIPVAERDAFHRMKTDFGTCVKMNFRRGTTKFRMFSSYVERRHLERMTLFSRISFGALIV